MELGILWWLAPPVVVTVVAMVWTIWRGRTGQREADREQAVARLERALRKEHPTLRRAGAAEMRARDRSTGIAVRPSRGE